MCYVGSVSIIGVRDLRQRASEVLRAVEAGESATVTVAGRPVAQLIPVHGSEWVTWERARRIFDYPTDPTWADERLEVGADELRDPWPA